MKKSNLSTRPTFAQKNIFVILKSIHLTRHQAQSGLKTKKMEGKKKEEKKINLITAASPAYTIGRNCKSWRNIQQPGAYNIHPRHGQARVRIFALSDSLDGQRYSYLI